MGLAVGVAREFCSARFFKITSRRFYCLGRAEIFVCHIPWLGFARVGCGKIGNATIGRTMKAARSRRTRCATSQGTHSFARVFANIFVGVISNGAILLHIARACFYRLGCTGGGVEIARRNGRLAVFDFYVTRGSGVRTTIGVALKTSSRQFIAIDRAVVGAVGLAT